MKYCSKCGTPAEDNQNFCLNCGSKLTAPVAQAAAAVDTAQGQLAAQQQQTAAAAQTMQDQLAAQQAAAAQAAATVQAQQQAAAEAAAQVAATAEAQQVAAQAAAQAKSAAEAAAKAEAMRQAANTAGGAEAVIAQSQATAEAAVAQAQAAAQQAVQPAVPVAQAVPAAAPVVQQAAPVAPGEKKKSGAGKWFAIIGFALVAVVLVIILLVNVLGSSYQTPIKKMISAMNSKSTDTDDYMSVYPKVFSNLYKDSMSTAKDGFKLIGKDNIAAMLDEMEFGASMNELFDSYEEIVGKNIKFSYAIQEKKELEPTTLAATANRYKSLAAELKSQAEKVEAKTKSVITNAGAKNKDAIDYCDKVKEVIEKAAAEIEAIDASAITAGYDVKVRMTIKGDKDEDRSEATYRVLKINGKWVFDATASSSMFDTDLLNSLVNMMMLKSY